MKTKLTGACLIYDSSITDRSLFAIVEQLNSWVSNRGLEALASSARQEGVRESVAVASSSSQRGGGRQPHGAIPLTELSLAHRKAFDNDGYGRA